MSFLDLLQTQTDKVTLTEMILVKKHLPDRVKTPVPHCMYIETEADVLAEVQANHKRLLDAVNSFLADKDDIEELRQVVESLIDRPSLLMLDYEVFNILCWIMARREKPEISLEDVGDKIGLNDAEGIPKITQAVIYFYTNHTREAIAEQYAASSEVSEATEKPENPTVSETSSET